MATRPCPPPQSRWTSPGWSTSPTSSSSSPPPAMLSFTQPRLYETKTLDLEADMCFQCFNVPYIQQKKENCWRPHQWWYLCLGEQSFKHADVFSEKNNFSAPGGPKSTIFGTDDVDPLYFEVSIVSAPSDPPYMSKNGKMCYFYHFLWIPKKTYTQSTGLPWKI